MTGFSEHAVYVDPAALPVTAHLGTLYRMLVRGADTGGAVAVMEERAAAGCMSPAHVHDRETETFVVLDGALEGWFEGTTTLVEAGCVLHLPPGHEHAFRVVSATAHYYNVITPGGFETFFEETGRPSAVPFDGPLPAPAPVSPEDVARMAAALEPRGCRLTGPPPFAP
jgi:quercetin dioxygenase-like cupin family protein